MSQLNRIGGGFSRRDFMKTSAALGAAAVISPGAFAQGQQKLRIGLIGCGGRGNGALNDCLEAGKIVGIPMEVVATADWFKHKAVGTGRGKGVPEERCFGGADGYKKVIAADVDVVLIATSPNFRPLHLEAAVKAGKHVFMEKPVAVDPAGGRRVIAAGEVAKAAGLAIVAGTQRRHEASYQKMAHRIAEGAIGTILGGAIYWCGGALWYQRKNQNESDADYMVRNWVSFTEMSGDHIVEQHVHNIDVAMWYLGRPPVAALGFGGRARRKTGNQFDFHSIDFDWGEGCHIHSMCRQINGTDGRVSEYFTGTNGTTWGNGGLNMINKKEITVPDFEERNPYVQEHVNLVRGILAGKPINEAKNVAEATLAAIMGRIATYTGKLVRWKDVVENANTPWYNITCSPSAEDFEKGPVKAPADEVAPIPGTD